MAKKKLFGNKKEPRCETCAHGKLSANGESVLCVQGGALPLTHSCRRYRYDPLRRVPKRRPLLDEYSAADFALDEQVATEDAVAIEEAARQEQQDREALNNLLEYLEEHETPDAQAILAILNRTPAEDKVAEDVADSAEDEPVSEIEQRAAEASAALDPDDSPDIASDLERLDMEAVPTFARNPLAEAKEAPAPVILPDSTDDDVVLYAEDSDEQDSVLCADDLLFLPKGTPSDHDDDDSVGGGFTPLSI